MKGPILNPTKKLLRRANRKIEEIYNPRKKQALFVFTTNLDGYHLTYKMSLDTFAALGTAISPVMISEIPAKDIDSKEYILNSVKDGAIKFNFETNLTYKFSCVFQLIGLLSLVYIIFDLAPKLFKDNRIIDMYPFLCIVTVSIVILLSYIFDFEKYINFF